MEDLNEKCTSTPSIEMSNESESQQELSKSESTLSKRALKRRAKALKWQETKAERRKKKKEEQKKRKLESSHPPKPKLVSRQKLKETTMATSTCKVSVVVDLSFDSYMDDKSIAKCVKQVQHCYSINRRSANPVQFYVTSLGGKCLTEITKNQGYKNWDVHFTEDHVTEKFSREQIIYLTSESENVIEKLEDDKVYVIGGLVDHNSHKGLCYKLATEKGLDHGRLPIDQYVDMKTRRVLTIDHVFNILVNVCNGQSWKDSFLQVLPSRTGVKELCQDVEKSVDESSSDNQNNNSENIEQEPSTVPNTVSLETNSIVM